MLKKSGNMLSPMLAVAAGASLMIVAAFPGCPQIVPSLYEVRVTKDVPYGQGYVSTAEEPDQFSQKPLLLDVYEPLAAEGSHPGIILIHGGSFSEGSKEKLQIVEYANFFAGQGYVAFAINYRLAGDRPPAPEGWAAFNLVSAAHAAMVDVKTAIRFVRENADQYDVDPERIALLGESAGAIAGVSAAVTDADDYAADGPGFEVPAENNAGEDARVQAYIHLWGSADHVLTEIDAGDPPVMIVHGTEDDEFFASFGASERFAAVLGLFDVPFIFYEAEGLDHGAWEFVYRRQGIPQLALNFLAEHM